jgi:hypothetical protein
MFYGERLNRKDRLLQLKQIYEFAFGMFINFRTIEISIGKFSVISKGNQQNVVLQEKKVIKSEKSYKTK